MSNCAVEVNQSVIARQQVGESRPGKAAGRAEPGEARVLTEEVSRFPPATNKEVAAPSKRAESEEEPPHLLSTTKGRYDLRAGIARMLKPADGGRGPAVCGCGYSAYKVDAVAIHLVGTGVKRKASVSGVYHCDSISACPVCSIRRAKKVEERLTTAAMACIDAGGMMCSLTLTVQRKRDQPLRTMKDGAATAFRKARQGSGWTKPSKAAGFHGLTTTVECPWSPITGHGLHFHILTFFDHRDEKKAVGHCELLISRYLAELADEGLVGKRQGQKIQALADGKAAAAYAAKAAREVAHGWVKEGRKAGSTAVHPFAVAARACIKDQDGNPLEVPGLEAVSPERACHVFSEYAEVFSGIRQGLISPVLAKKLGIKSEKEEVADDAEQQFEAEKAVVGVVDSELWNRLMSRALAGTFLSKVEVQISFDQSGKVLGWAEIIEWAEKETGVQLDRETTRATEEWYERNRVVVESDDVPEHDFIAPEPSPPKPKSVYVSVGHVWAEAHERTGYHVTHRDAGFGRIMAQVPAAIDAIREDIVAGGEEAMLPTEAEVWASILERVAA